MAASKTAMASLIHYRPLTCAASASASHPTRLVPHAPDLIKWVRREGGFVHEAVKIAQDELSGLGLAAADKIPEGSDLIALPHHVPLRFQSNGGDAAERVLVGLASKVPGTVNIGFLLLAESSEVTFLIVVCIVSLRVFFDGFFCALLAVFSSDISSSWFFIRTLI